MFVVLAASPVKVAATGFQVTGIEERVADAWVERFSAVMAEGGRVKVTTQRDVAQLLGLERQKQLLGCADAASSCLAELAGALGVDAVLSGTIVKSGSGFLVTLKVLRVGDGSVWASASERVKSEDALQDLLDDTARRFALVLGGEEAPKPTPRAVRWVPGIAGAAAAVTGAVLFGLSKSDASTLRTAAQTPGFSGDLAAVARRGQTFEIAGLTLIGVGVAGIAASVLWLLLDSPPPASVAFIVTPAGGALTLRGVFP